jgi:MYXO-CTERM domain-containing protein
MKIRVFLILAIACVFTSSAEAHVTLMFPKRTATNEQDQKGPAPCGVARPKNPQTFKPGETITLLWRETVSHEGHFRVAFGPSTATFPAPKTRKDTSTDLPLFIDGIDEKIKKAAPVNHMLKITFPDQPCAACTLQVIQIMAVDPPYDPTPGSDIYYQCADIVLAGDPVGGTPDAGADAAVLDMGGGAGGAGGSTPGAGGAPGGDGGSTGSGGTTMTGNGGTGPSGAGGKAMSAKGGSSGAKGGAGGTADDPGPDDSPSSPSSGCSVGGHQRSVTTAGFILLAAVLARRTRRRR